MFTLSGQARWVGEGRRSCCGRSNTHGRESRGRNKKTEPVVQAPSRLVFWNYAAVVFFAGLGCAFGFTFFAAWAFAFAVNSCFTLRAMASVSTL